ncbi:MAG: hypothetical protein ACRDWA_07335 [Acidimicrobiia bacterium]
MTAWPADGHRFRRPLQVGHVGLAVPFAAAIVAARLPVRDNSYLWHVRAGTVQIDQTSVLTTDPFSFTAGGQPWRTQSWLADLLYGWGDRLWGLDLVAPLVLVGAVLLVATIAVRASGSVGTPLLAAWGTVWILWLTIGYFTPRPVLLSLSLLGLFLLAADREKLRWALVPLMWIWASVHGGFVVGLGYLVLDGLRRRDRARVWDTAGAGLVTLLTAHGWGVWETIFTFARSGEALDLIVEWLPPDFTSVEHLPFGLGILALLVGAMKGRIEPRDLWVVGPFLLFAFTANRAVPLASLVLAPFFLQSLVRMSSKGMPSKATNVETRLNAVLLCAVLVIPVLVPLAGGLDRELFAVEAITHLAPGRAFHDDAVGGYLIYAEWPERQVYVDDRAELYGDAFVDFVRARAGNAEWREVFDRYQIRQALLKVEDPLAQILAVSGWQERFRDEKFVILSEPDVA